MTIKMFGMVRGLGQMVVPVWAIGKGGMKGLRVRVILDQLLK